MIYTVIQRYAGKLAPWKTKLLFVASADLCGVKIPLHFNSLLAQH